MNTTRKNRRHVLCICLVFALLLSVLYPAACAADTADVTFIVPEVIYLAPDYDSYAAAGSYPFQWYVNNTVSGNTVTPNAYGSTTGRIAFSYAGATQAQITYEWVDASGGSITIDGTIREPGSAFALSGNAIILAGVSPAMSAAQSGTYLRWTAQFVDSTDGLTKSVQAYTYVYKPYVQPVGTALKTKNTRGSNTYGSNLSWISGVHAADTATGFNAQYPRTLTTAEGYGFLPFSSAANAGVQIGSLYAQFASADSSLSRFRYEGFNNVSPLNWLTATADASTVLTDATVSTQTNEMSGHTSGNDAFHNYTLSPFGLLTVDGSRYTNLSQIPNLSVGMMVTDDENAETGAWFVADYTGTPGTEPLMDYQKSMETAALPLWNQYKENGTVLAADAAPDSSTGPASLEGVKYNGVWSKQIPSGAGAMNAYVGTGYFNDEGGDTIWNISELRCRITVENKAALRSAVQNAVRAAGTVNSTVITDTQAWNEYAALYTAAYKALTMLDNAYTPQTVNGTTYDTMDALAAALSAKTDELKQAEPPVPSAGVAFAVGNVRARAGKSVSVAIEIPQNSGIISATLKIFYDSTKLQLTGAENGTLFGEDTYTAGNDLTKVPYTVLWAAPTIRENITSTGTIVTLRFVILSDAAAGVVPITVEASSVYDVALNPVPSAVTNGSVEIMDCLPGDAGGDGVVDLKDVVEITRYLAGGWDIEIDLFAADVDADGEVTLKDVILLRRHLAGWDVELQ